MSVVRDGFELLVDEKQFMMFSYVLALKKGAEIRARQGIHNSIRNNDYYECSRNLPIVHIFKPSIRHFLKSHHI